MSEEELDLDRYRLEELRDEILGIVDVGSAISALVLRSSIGPIVVAITTFLVAGSAFSGWLAVLFASVAGMLAIPAAMAIGAWLIVRQRLGAVTDASVQVLETVSLMHADLDRLRSGAAEASVHEVSTHLVEEAIVPIVFGTLTQSVTGLLGPLSFIGDRLAQAPMRWVERTVVKAVTLLPDRSIGDLLDAGSDPSVIAEVPELDRLRTEYHKVTGRLDEIVVQVSRVSTLLGVGGGAMASIPLLVWWFFGWMVS